MSTFQYTDHNDTSITLPVYNFKASKFNDEGVIFPKTLFAAMHPGVSAVVGEVPTATELNNKQPEIDKYVWLF